MFKENTIGPTKADGPVRLKGISDLGRAKVQMELAQASHKDQLVHAERARDYAISALAVVTNHPDQFTEVEARRMRDVVEDLRMINALFRAGETEFRRTHGQNVKVQAGRDILSFNLELLTHVQASK